VGGGEALFDTEFGFGHLRVNTTDFSIDRYDKQLRYQNSSPALEHYRNFPPVGLLNTDGTYNGTHYFILSGLAGVPNQVLVYDRDFNFVQNITTAVNLITVTYNGSDFIGLDSDTNNLIDLDSGLLGNTIMFTPTDFGISPDGAVTQMQGDIYIAYTQNNSVIGKWDSQGTPITFFNFTDLVNEFRLAMGNNGSNIFVDNFIEFSVFDSSLSGIIDTIPFSVGTTEHRSLTFDGVNWWIVSRSLDRWFKYDFNFNFISSFSILDNGSNWRGGTVIGDNLYGFEDDLDKIFVWNKNTEVSLFSFDISPFPNALGDLRGLQTNGSHLFISNDLGLGLGADIGIFDANGVYQNINISLDGTDTLIGAGSKTTQVPDFTPSTDIVTCGSSGVGNPSPASLLRYNITGSLLEAINFSTIPIDPPNSFCTGVEYLQTDNRLYILPQSANGNVFILDGGLLNITPFVINVTPPVITAAATIIPLEGTLNFIGLIVLFLIILAALGFKNQFNRSGK